MATNSWSLDDNVSQPPQLPPETHNNTTYRHPEAVRFTSSHQATARPRPISRAFLRANNPINLSPPPSFTQGRRRAVMQPSPSMRRLVSSGTNLSTRGHEPDRYHPDAARVQTGEGQSTSGSSNTTPRRLDRHQGPRGLAQTDSRWRRDREERKLQQHLQRRLNDNWNPAASQTLEAICVVDTRSEVEKVTVPVQSLFCRGQPYSAVHPRYLLRRLGIEPQYLPPGTSKQVFLYPNGICYPRKYTDLVIEQSTYKIRGEVERFLVLDKNVPYKGIDIYIGQRFLDKYFNGNLPQHLPPDSAVSGQANHWPAGLTGVSQSVVGSENMTPSIAASGSGLGLHSYYNASVPPMTSLPEPIIWDMTGAPGYGTAPPQPEQWGTSPDLPGGAQYPIRPNDYNNGAVFGTQPDLGHFGPFNTTPLDPNGPPAHSGDQSPPTFYPGYDMMSEDTNPGSSSNWFQAP